MKNDIYNPAEYARVSVVADEAAMNMVSRLDLVALKPRRILDMGCRTGSCTALLKKHYPDAAILALESSWTMLNYAQKNNTSLAEWVCADALQLPIRQHAVDLIVANWFIPKHVDIKKIVQEWHRVLRPEGLLMFTSAGPDTLMELCDNEMERLHYVDMHNWGDALIAAGFSDPVMDVQHLTLRYRQWEDLLHELQVTEMVPNTPLQHNKKTLSVTYEIIYGHAFGSYLGSEYNSDEQGVVKIPLSHLRKHHF